MLISPFQEGRRRAPALLLGLLLAIGARAANTSSTGSYSPVALGQPGLGLRYMIALQGVYPTSGSAPAAGGEQLLGEIRLFAFSIPGVPGGWAECNGQLLAINQNTALFSLLGTTYGGNGSTTFGLPDLRGRIPVGQGSGGGLTPRVLGESFGAASQTLVVNHLPSHIHSMAGGAFTGPAGGNQPFPIWRPSLALNPIISPSGVFEYLPEIRWFPGNFQPGGWFYADGRTLPIASYTALFSHLGVNYGGNGTTTFQLPRLTGRAAIGAGQGPGLSAYLPGDQFGAETVTLSGSLLTAHTHTTAAGATGATGGSLPIDWRQPTTAIRYMIAIYGVFPSSGFNPGPSPTIGEIRAFAGNLPPPDFMFCEGQLLAIADNEPLFYLLGTTFGGDGNTTFALPDLRGQVPIGHGTGPGLPSLPFADPTGVETIYPSVPQLAGHFHSQPAPAIAVTGNAVAIANGDTTPSLSDFTQFASVDVAGGATTRGYTISNGGLGDLSLVSASLSGNAAFSVLASPAAVVAPGGSTTLQLSFDPTAEGIFTSTATITSDDSVNSPFTFRVGGNGANNLAARHPGALRGGVLTVRKNGADASRLDLSWGNSCQADATGYAVYEGALGNFSSHALFPGLCNTTGPANGLLPAIGNRYYLVSAIDGLALEEGSLGQNTAGGEYLHPANACMAATDLVSCAAAQPLAGLDGAGNASTFEISAQAPLPALGWTALSGTAQIYDLASNGGLVGTTQFGNYQVEYLTGVAIAPYSAYQLTVDMGFMASVAGGSASYTLELGTTNGGVFTPLRSTSGTVTRLGNLSGGVISGSATVTLSTTGSVSGHLLTVRWRQTANPGPSDYFGIDNVRLTIAN